MGPDEPGESEEPEDIPEEEEESWHEAVLCPTCGSDETQFMKRHYEVSVYLCERCGMSFEADG